LKAAMAQRSMIKRIKDRLRTEYPRLYRYVYRGRHHLQAETRLMRRIGLGSLLRMMIHPRPSWQKSLPMQSPRRVVVSGVDVRTKQELMRYVSGIAGAVTAGHTVYLPPGSVLGSAFRVLGNDYPPHFGIKILRNVGEADQVRYIYGLDTVTQVKVAYSPRHLTMIANCLHIGEVGPRMYDLVELQCGDFSLTAYEIEHVDGRTPTVPEWHEGMTKIQQMMDHSLIDVIAPDGLEDGDFECPECNGNMLVERETGKISYIDFQNFIFTNYKSFLGGIIGAATSDSYGSGSVLRKAGRNFYESIRDGDAGAMRDAAGRVQIVQELIRRSGVLIRDRLVLDIGCDMGAMMAHYLKWGAKWCHGWDNPGVTRHAERLLLALGCTRFSLSMRDLRRGPSLDGDIAEFLKPMLRGCVISYLGVHDRLGWLEILGRIPWSCLVYEGGQGEDEQECMERISELGRFRRVEIGAMEKCGDASSATVVAIVMAGELR